MDRQDFVDAFRRRLEELIPSTHGAKATWSRDLGIDRGTLAQLLAPDNRRLPRVETLIAIARYAEVSVDWLLGLDRAGGEHGRGGARHPPMTIIPNTGSPDDEQLLTWLAEARGAKIRYIPTTLPDLLKTTEVIRYEATGTPAGTLRRDMGVAAIRLDWQRRPEADMECCGSIQSLEGFAHGEGTWNKLPSRTRRIQLEHMADLAHELYPTFRWFLYDGRLRYAAPVTVFGLQRAALYVGQMYVVFNADEEVLAMARHFDSLLKAATVTPREIPALCRRLIRSAGI